MKIKSVRTKILFLSISAVLLVSLAMVGIIIQQKGPLQENIGEELDQLAKNETSKIARDVYLMARAADEILQGQLDVNLKVLTEMLKGSGVSLSWETVSWQAKNQSTGSVSNVTLPKLMVGNTWLGHNTDQSVRTPFIDDAEGLVGGTITVFQKMNDAGDMLRVATNVINENGERAIGTYIPAIGHGGTPNPIITAVKNGKTYHGMAEVLGKAYLTAYGPITDTNGKLVGMTVSAIAQDQFASLRQGIMDIVVGKTGYVFVLGGKGAHKGNYLISYQGKRDGENILGAKDADGKAFIQSIIEKATKTKNGSVDFETYAWKNKGDTESRVKLSAVTYFEPWDWVIGAGAYQDDFFAAKERVEKSIGSMVMWGAIGALILLALATLATIILSGSIAKPLVRMVKVANALAEGDIQQEIQVNTSDEVGQLGEAFQSMIDSQKEMAAAAQSVATGDTSVSITPKSDKDVLATSLKGMIEVIQKLLTETNNLTESTLAGDLSKRGDADSFEGGYKDLVDGINRLVEAFIGPMSVTSEYIQRISAGDIPDKITEEYHGDFNTIKVSLNGCIDAVDLLVSDMNALVQAAVDGQLSTRADVSRHQGDFASIVNGVNETLNAIIEPINEASDVLEQLANRDMTVRVKGDYQGDHAKIKDNLNMTAEALDDALSQVAEASDQVASAGDQIASSSQAVAEGASEQASSLEETSSSLEEMSSMTKQNADNAQQANSMAQDAKAIGDEGIAVMNKMSGAMGSIKESAQGTAAIIKDINEIAFQTNLLALNAAVEAARAGEAGRGFAVVAEEVRNLALRSKEAAAKTEQLIKESVNLAEGGESITLEVNEKLSQIVDSVGKVTGIVAEISTASLEQARGIEQINKAVNQMDVVTQQNAANSEESSSASEELSSQAQELAAMVGRFTVSKHRGQREHKKALTFGSKKKDSLPSKPQNGSLKAGISLTPEDVIPLDDDPDFAEF